MLFMFGFFPFFSQYLADLWHLHSSDLRSQDGHWSLGWIIHQQICCLGKGCLLPYKNEEWLKRPKLYKMTFKRWEGSNMWVRCGVKRWIVRFRGRDEKQFQCTLVSCNKQPERFFLLFLFEQGKIWAFCACVHCVVPWEMSTDVCVCRETGVKGQKVCWQEC